MKRFAVTPELVLDDEMYGLAHEALRQYAPDKLEDFTWKRFTRLESWVFVPDVEHPERPWYKAEFVIKDEKPFKQTVKLNVWMFPDLRRDGAPMPHSHPWAFTGHVLMGGYQEDRYQVSEGSRLIINPHIPWNMGDVSVTQNVAHQASSNNFIPLTTFHEVTEVFEPGRTMSLMDCDQGRKEGWGYLDPNTGLYTPTKLTEPDPRFKAMLIERNPHLKK